MNIIWFKMCIGDDEDFSRLRRHICLRFLVTKIDIVQVKIEICNPCFHPIMQQSLHAHFVILRNYDASLFLNNGAVL